MNSSTFRHIAGGTGRNQIAPQVLSTTTETLFVKNTDTAGTTTIASLAIPTQTEILGSQTPYDANSNSSKIFESGRQYGPPLGAQRPFFNSTSFDSAKPFYIHLFGTFTSGVAANDLKISLYLGNAVIGSDTAISAALTTGTAGNFGAVSGKFMVEYLMYWDSTTGKLDGIVTDGVITPSAVASTVIGGTAVTETSVAAYTSLVFSASAKWNAANAGNTVNVTEFSLAQF